MGRDDTGASGCFHRKPERSTERQEVEQNCFFMETYGTDYDIEEHHTGRERILLELYDERLDVLEIGLSV